MTAVALSGPARARQRWHAGLGPIGIAQASAPQGGSPACQSAVRIRAAQQRIDSSPPARGHMTGRQGDFDCCAGGAGSATAAALTVRLR